MPLGTLVLAIHAGLTSRSADRDPAWTRPAMTRRSRSFSGLAVALTQCGPHGVAHDPGQVFAQAPDAFLDPIEATIVPVKTALDPFEALFCPSLKRQQVLVDAANLLHQEPERTFNLANAALEITNLCFNIHGHGDFLA